MISPGWTLCVPSVGVIVVCTAGTEDLASPETFRFLLFLILNTTTLKYEKSMRLYKLV